VNHTKLHKWLTLLWVFLIPVSVILKDSILWVVVMSHYAIVASHWAACEAADDPKDSSGVAGKCGS
jgi:hypothetical protein